MFKEKKILAVIPARGGSKGIPKKNIKLLSGKPLISWTIEAAKKSKYIDRLILSSEDSEIILKAEKLGCEVPFIRPKELSTDKTSTIDVILHAIAEIKGFDYILVLQPTSPFRTTKDIDDCVELTLSSHKNACVSLTESPAHPQWIFQLGKDNSLVSFIRNQDIRVERRQDLPSAFVLNGAIYFADINWLKMNKTFISTETIGYLMPPDRSVDLDSPEDWKLAENIATKL